MASRTLLRWIIASLLLMAVATSANAELKVGAVNLAKVSNDAPQAEAATEKLEQEFGPRDQELDAMQKDLREMELKLERDGAVMSRDQRADLEKEIVNMRREVRRTRDEFREDLNIRRNEELGKLQRRIFQAIQVVAKDQGFDLVLTDGVVYASDKVDITALVIEQLRKDAQAGAQ